MLFSYSVQIGDGAPRRGEVEASSATDAAKFAALRHADQGLGCVVISRIFEPPLHHGLRVLEAHDLPRVNFKHSLYERPLRRQARDV